MARSRDPLLVAAVLAATALPATTAQASEWALSPSVFVQLTLGRNWNAGIGTDFRMTWLEDGYGNSRNDYTIYGLGAFGQIVAQVRGDGLMVGAGIHGQRYTGMHYWREDTKALSAELGWVYRKGLPVGGRGHGALIGLSRFVMPWDMSARATVVRTNAGWQPEAHFTAGLRYPGASTVTSRVVEGRPQRDGDTFSLGEVYLRSAQVGGSLGKLDTTRLAIGLDWLEAARAEAASVPAFLALARDLANAGAPVNLVSRALFAAVEELGHAKSSAAIAGAVLQCDVAVEVPPLVTAKETTKEALLERLAVDSWRDGLVGEAAAAQQAAIGARTARVPAIQRTLAAIAKEEATHAQLAADVVAWSIAVGGEPVVASVLAAANEDMAEPAPSLSESVSVARWQAAGRVTAADAGAAHRQATWLARRTALSATTIAATPRTC